MVAIIGPARAVRRWWTRPVTNPQPLIGGTRVTRGEGTRGKHSVGEDTVPLGVLLERMGHVPQPRRREPRLFGTAPLIEWTHPERYRPPVRPPVLVTTVATTPNFAEEA